MAVARERLVVALDAAGWDGVRVRLRVIESIDDAALFAFGGSPTIMVEGSDLFAGNGRSVGLTCRLYQTPHGLAGSPTVQQLIAALQGIR